MSKEDLGVMFVTLVKASTCGNALVKTENWSSGLCLWVLKPECDDWAEEDVDEYDIVEKNLRFRFLTLIIQHPITKIIKINSKTPKAINNPPHHNF